MNTCSLAPRPTDLMLAGPLGSFEAYAERISRISVLTREQEAALFERLHKNQDLDAARTLVMSHLRFVLHVARGYIGYGLPLGDLVQEGNVGLMKAVKRFNPEQGVRLVSFAVHWIRAEIHDYVLRNWRLVKIATTKSQRKLFFNLRRMKKNLAWLSADETQAVARDLGVSVAEVTEMEQRLSARDLSFDPTPESGDEDESYGPALFLPAPDADPAVSAESEQWDEDVTRRLADAMAALDARSQDIVRRRWMAEDKATLHELAAEYDISAERVRQIEVAAMKRLKKLMSTDEELAA
ncbi:MAG: RNA polymerase sigma factor RpoH [Proteobacteria bacterium]|nr:RNA polymerase sigma factor RpoH [Pseudomonadota bacterium]